MNMEEKILQIPIEDIIPNRFQPRLTFDDQALQELASSIKQHGIIQPLVLRKLGDKYEIIAGERRYKAAQIAGLTSVPAVISNIDDDKSAEVALIENIQRRNLTSIEEAKSYKNLLDRGYMTQEQLAEKLGVSQSTIANKLRLLNLCDEVQDALLNERISERHARALLALKDKDEQIKWLNKILNDRLTVRQLDIELKKALNTSDDEDASIPIVNNLTPNIDEIKSNALDINPTQGLHDIESMLKPSMPGEKVYDLSNPVDSIETLDLNESKNNLNVTPSQPQNKFFNILEDEGANMNENDSIDDIFSKQPDFSSIENNNNLESNEILNIDNNSLDVNNYESLNISNDLNNIDNVYNPIHNENDLNNVQYVDNNIISSLNKPVFDQNIVYTAPDDSSKNNIELNDSVNIENQEPVENIFFNFGKHGDDNNIDSSNSVMENNIIEQNNNIPEMNQSNNVIELVQEPVVDNVFDPMSMVNTLEPDYQEKIEEQNGTDLKTAINVIRDTRDSLEQSGFNINLDEADLGDTYTITINIIK